MKPCSARVARVATSLYGFAGLWLFGLAHAQTAAPALVASPPSTAESAAASTYQDRYIDGGSLAPDISAGEESTPDTAGLARSLQVDGVLSVLHSHDSGLSNNVVENGLIVKSQWETAAYGAWSLDAAARTGGSGLGESAQGQGVVATLRQRAMPFDGGWQADNGLGDLNSPDITLARFQPRFYLPTAPMQGVTTEWRGPSQLQLVAGAGVPGLYDGIEVPDFRTLGGSTATAGAQWSPASHWTLGGQLIEAHDVNLYTTFATNGSSPLSSTTGLLSAAWQDSAERVQLNVLDGELSGQPDHSGGWLDASILQGRILQNAGIFRIDPDLT
ncbi:MAG: hypothetical protein ACREU6_12775, partial [Steroidobacteraceae bacterium]